MSSNDDDVLYVAVKIDEEGGQDVFHTSYVDLKEKMGTMESL